MATSGPIPGSPLKNQLSQKTTVSPFKVWRSKLPKEVQRKERTPSPNKKSQSHSKLPHTHGRPCILERTSSMVSAVDLSSVRDSDLARSTIGDHELKLLRELEGTDGSDYVTTYKEFRKKLLKKHDPIKMAKISQPKKNIAKLKMAVRLIKGKNLAFLCKAQLASSSSEEVTTSLMKKIHQMKLEAGLLAPEQEPRRGTTTRGGSGDDMEVETKVRSEDKETKVTEPISYDKTMDLEKEREVEKTFKYVVGQHANSPFTAEVLPLQQTPSAVAAAGGKKKKKKDKKDKGHGKEPTLMRDLRNKGFIKNAQALRIQKLKADKKNAAAAAAGAQNNTSKNTNQTQYKARKVKKPHSHPYQAHHYSEHIKQEEVSAKHPEKLRQACDKKKHDPVDDSQPMHMSHTTWTRLKAKDNDLKEKESLTIMGSLSQPFSPSHSLLQRSVVEPDRDRDRGGGGGPESLPEEERRGETAANTSSPSRRFDPPAGASSSSNLISGDALLYSMEREGLFTVDDLDDLSLASEDGSQELVEDASAVEHLFPTLDLLLLDVDEHDPALQLLAREEGGGEGGEEEEGGVTPDGVLAASMGTLLCSPQLRQEVSTRPASASRLGGVSKSSSHRSPLKLDQYSYHKKYSLDITKRPKSANTSPHVRSNADFEDSRAIPNYVQKKRLTVNRHISTEVWIN